MADLQGLPVEISSDPLDGNLELDEPTSPLMEGAASVVAIKRLLKVKKNRERALQNLTAHVNHIKEKDTRMQKEIEKKESRFFVSQMTKWEREEKQLLWERRRDELLEEIKLAGKAAEKQREEQRKKLDDIKLKVDLKNKQTADRVRKDRELLMTTLNSCREKRIDEQRAKVKLREQERQRREIAKQVTQILEEERRGEVNSARYIQLKREHLAIEREILDRGLEETVATAKLEDTCRTRDEGRDNLQQYVEQIREGRYEKTAWQEETSERLHVMELAPDISAQYVRPVNFKQPALPASPPMAQNPRAVGLSPRPATMPGVVA